MSSPPEKKFDGGGSGSAGLGTDSGMDGGGATSRGGSGGAGTRSNGSAEAGVDGQALVPGGATNKLDLLLVVDNSSSMRDKQDVLKAAVPDLVTRITDIASGITDLHVGVITTSLGDHGAGSTCPGSGATALEAEEADDDAHLLGTRPRAASLDLPSGFASWSTGQSPATVTAQVQGLIGAADQDGCGFEATLESMYRFLVDPAPPASITLQPCPTFPSEQCATSTGTDQTILDQRKAFLRPDSAVAIVVLSDENDCSIRDEQQAYLAATRSFTTPNGTDPCATNPNDPCCYNCDQAPPGNCPAASSYSACGSTAAPNDTIGNFNLRCWNEKGRFGVDFLYPIARYVNALTKPEICTSRDDLDPAQCSSGLVRNPLFSAGPDGGAPLRNPSLVFLSTIVGVPWQDLQTPVDPTGAPYPANELHWKTPETMASDGTWDLILGDSTKSPPALPIDPLMIESPSPRTGTDPTPSVGPLVGADGAPRFGTAGANPANGHEWNDVAVADLEFACIFQLSHARLEDSTPDADCGSGRDPNDDSPLCQNTDGTYGTTQYFAKGYPGLRELSVARGLGKSGLASSICSRNLGGLEAEDYGYRPAALALIAALKTAVK